MPPTNLNSLSNELLTLIVTHLTQSRVYGTDIFNLRLVSRHFNALASPFLITSTSISFTSPSFHDLEYLANHLDFAKGVQKVEVDVSYFDAWLVCEEKRSGDLGDEEAGKDFWDGNGAIVRDSMTFGWERFVTNCGTNLNQKLEWMERAAWNESSSEDSEWENSESENEKDRNIGEVGESISASLQRAEAGFKSTEDLEVEEDPFKGCCVGCSE
jgi:hypothetical protein